MWEDDRLSDAWIADARNLLITLRSKKGGGWGYRKDSRRLIEPSALAALSLIASAPEGGDADGSESREVALDVANWMAGLAQPNGSTGMGPKMPEPAWPTAFALWLWSALDAQKEAAAKATELLIARKGLTSDAPYDHLGHDPSIEGWPWYDGTAAWVEPSRRSTRATRTSPASRSPARG